MTSQASRTVRKRRQIKIPKTRAMVSSEKILPEIIVATQPATIDTRDRTPKSPGKSLKYRAPKRKTGSEKKLVPPQTLIPARPKLLHPEFNGRWLDSTPENFSLKKNSHAYPPDARLPPIHPCSHHGRNSSTLPPLREVLLGIVMAAVLDEGDLHYI